MSDRPPDLANGSGPTTEPPSQAPTSHPEPIAAPPRSDAQDATTSQPRQESSCGTPTSDPSQPLSKNARKKLKRQLAWEANTEDRKRRRKEKRQEIRVRKREERDELRAEAKAAGLAPPKLPLPQRKKKRGALVPVGIIIDCGFDDVMENPFITSLSSQITRAYSENRVAPLRPHLWISGWGGRLKERFEGPMKGTHLFWKGIEFEEDGWVEVARKAKGVFENGLQRELPDILKPVKGKSAIWLEKNDTAIEEEVVREENVVYLSSESPYVLERLEPGMCYVIGGLVDKNKKKGLCYKLARDAGVRTAKLPIGRYLEMDSRKVLATNHVVEILLKWLQFGDWGKAFMAVMPQRKGGKLKETGENAGDVEGTHGEDDELNAEEEMAKAMAHNEEHDEEDDEIRDQEGVDGEGEED